VRTRQRRGRTKRRGGWDGETKYRKIGLDGEERGSNKEREEKEDGTEQKEDA
jgi:hypothetical protein